MSKIMKDLRYLPYSEMNKIASHSFIDAGGRHKTLGSETKDFITSRNSKNQSNSISLGQFSKPQFPQDNTMNTQWVTLWKRSPAFRKSESFKIDSRLLFAPEGLSIVFKGYLLYRHPGTVSVEQRKAFCAYTSGTCRNTGFSQGIISQHDEKLKSRDITLPTKVHLVKAMVFPVVMYGCESWTIKKAECRRIVAF